MGSGHLWVVQFAYVSVMSGIFEYRVNTAKAKLYALCEVISKL